jgi:CheY-like chemotaxis protein
MARSRVLLVGDRDHSPRALSDRLERDSDHGLATEVVALIGEALERVSAKGYDAAVCWAERQDELAAVIRLRKASASLPIVLLTSQADPAFGELAHQMGATCVFGGGPELSAVSETLRMALSTGQLARDVLARAREARAGAVQVRELAEANRGLVEKALVRARKESGTSILPLLVEDDPDQALLMVRAFQRADVFAPLPLMRTGEEAIRYLSGEPPFQHRSRFPLPSLVLLDYNLPGISGQDVLEWIKAQSSLRAVRVVMLSSQRDPDVISRAYEAGVDAFLTKPAGFGALVELVEGLRDHWGRPRPHE